MTGIVLFSGALALLFVSLHDFAGTMVLRLVRSPLPLLSFIVVDNI